MPNPLAFCTRCNAPVYNPQTPDGCNCLDGRLLGLLALKRASDQAKLSGARPQASLPDLAPEMLLSGDGLSEYRAMTAPLPPPRTRTGSQADRGARERPGRESFSGPLESLWMSGSEMMDMGGDFDQATYPEPLPPEEEFDVDWGADMDFDSPRGGVRFRADRAPAPPPTPSGPRVGQDGPFSVMLDGGEHVGDRGSMRAAARAQGMAAGMNFREIRAAAVRSATAPPPPVVRSAPVAPTKPPRSFYERLVKR